jgi:opacity protein-like surface antigen
MKSFSALVVLLSFSYAKAGLLGNSVFVEPFIGYKNESIKFVDLTNNATSVKTAAPSFGIKLGYRSLLGIDLNLSADTSTGNAEISTTPDKSKFSHNSASVELGINSFGMIKMYLGTSFLNDFKTEDSPSVQAFKLAGPAYFAGLQFKLLTSLNFGLQYNLNQYNTISGNAYTSGDKVETYYTKIDTQDYTIYISFPL